MKEAPNKMIKQMPKAVAVYDNLPLCALISLVSDSLQ